MKRKPKRFITTSELADRLGLTSARVVQLIEEGRVLAIRPTHNGQYRIRVEEAERLEREAERRAAG